MGWALEATRIGPDGADRPCLTAHGGVSTGGGAARGGRAPTRPTTQAAQQCGVRAQITCATQFLRKDGTTVAITFDTPTAYFNVRNAVPEDQTGDDAPARPSKRPRLLRKGQKRRRGGDPKGSTAASTTAKAGENETSHHLMCRDNHRALDALQRAYPNRLTLRIAEGAPRLQLTNAAVTAARTRDNALNVHAAGGSHELSVSLWDELTVWDPGD